MIVTEKEALGKWCRFSRVDVVLPASAVEIRKETTLLHHAVNRVENAQTGQARLVGMCLGSKCMAWRWGSTAMVTKHMGQQVGYCGAAGIPNEAGIEHYDTSHNV